MSSTPALRYQQDREEGQVRLTAQRILTAHLKPKEAAAFWKNIDLDLTEAHLHEFNLASCQVRTALFDRAEFAGDAGFRGAEFAGNAGFSGAEFAGNAAFYDAEFAGNAWFDEARVAQNAGRIIILPTGWITRAARPAEEEGWLYVVRDEDSSEQPAEAPPDNEGGSGSSGEGREQEA